MEVHCVGVAAIKMDKRSMIIRRVITAISMRTSSILVELMKSRRVKKYVLSCFMIVGQP